MGWVAAEVVPCMYTFDGGEGADCTLVTTVDDLLFSEGKVSKRAIQRRTTQLLNKRLECELTYHEEPTSHAGYCFARDRSRRAITIHMAKKLEAACTRHLPSWVDRSKPPPDALLGRNLERACDALVMPHADARAAKLSRAQKVVQEIIGDLRYPEKVTPAITRYLHALSCINAYPPANAHLVAISILVLAYSWRHVGITYGGGGLSSQPRVTSGIKAEFYMRDAARRRTWR